MSAAPGPRFVEDGGGRGVRVYAGPRSEPDPAALERLLAVSRMPFVAAPVVALPDLHWKDRLETPSSAAAATDGVIVMSLSSPSQNCGMNLLATPLDRADLDEGFLDKLMDGLRAQLPRRRRSPALSRDDVIEYCRRGGPAAAARYGLDPAQCAAMEAGGDTLASRTPSRRETVGAVDEKSLDLGRYSFAYIGGGNHFLELQVVTDILNAGACRVMGLREGQLVAMFHTGSERLGHDLGRLYSFRRKTDPSRRRRLFLRKVRLHLMKNVRGWSDLRNRWNYHIRRQDYAAVPADSHEGRRIRLTLKLAANYGYANRVAVAGLIQEAFRAATGRADLALRIVADLSHNTIMRERVDGRDLWVHRHNAARVVGPSGLPDAHPYRAIGQPVMVPGTNRTSSFMVVGREGSALSLHSVDHGAGRTVDRFEQAGLLAPRPGGVTRKYTYDSPAPEILRHMSDEAIDEVMAVAVAGDLAAPAARLRPVAVLKA